MECEGCGADLEFGDRFCGKCGAITECGKSSMQVLGESLRESGEVLGALFRDGMAYARQAENRGKVAIGIGAILLLLVVLTDNPISSTLASAFETELVPPQLAADGAPDLASYEDNFLSEEAEYLVTGIANVRNFPTSQGTIIVQTFEGGEVVRAREVRAFDPTSHWFRLGDGRYIWGENLALVDNTRQSARPQFPGNLRGTWSTMDHCRGGDFDNINNDHC